jgi:formylglycine-generating enzyme required for sulfatase activity
LFEANGYDMLMRALRARAENIGAELKEKRGWFPKISTPIVKSEKQETEETPTPPKGEDPEQAKKQDARVEDSGPKPKVTDKPTREPFKLKTEYLIATIGAMAIIIGVIIGSPLIERMFAQGRETVVTVVASDTLPPTLSPTETFTPLPTTFPSPILLPTETFTPGPTAFPSPTLSPTKTFTPAPTALPFEITDAQGVEMVLVPEGEFSMGSERGGAASPVHQVYLATYYIDKYEVTNDLYKVCEKVGVCDKPTESNDYNNPQFAQHPVVNVNWNMAKEYCEWRGARLPTEAEWEKAARGTDGRIYPWGNDKLDGTFANFCDSNCIAWARDGNSDDGYKTTSPVGSYPKGVSPYGAYDMAGNVWEWVADWYDAYPGNTDSDSKYGTKYRGLRGGSWANFNTLLRSYFRYWEYPIDLNFGIRCARDISP